MTVTSPIGFFGSRSWRGRRIRGLKVRDARASLIGLGTVRGGEKISRRRTVCVFFLFFFLPLFGFPESRGQGERKINFGEFLFFWFSGGK